jgi:hypothetical protein
MNYEVERIWKEEIVVSFVIFSWHLPTKPDENNSTLGRM